MMNKASPFHVFRTLFCRALAYEKDTCHGLGDWFMAFRLRVASSSDCPPDRNMIPGTAGGTRLLSRFRVYLATVSGDSCTHEKQLLLHNVQIIICKSAQREGIMQILPTSSETCNAKLSCGP